MSFVIRVVSYMGNSIEWRNHTFSIDDDGLMHEDAKTDAELIVKEDS